MFSMFSILTNPAAKIIIFVLNFSLFKTGEIHFLLFESKEEQYLHLLSYKEGAWCCIKWLSTYLTAGRQLKPEKLAWFTKHLGKVGYVFLRVTYLTLITFSFYETAPVWIRVVYFWRDYLINPSEITEHKTEVWMF